MNINNFEYVNEPYIKMKKYKVHVLSDEGFSKYLDKDSYIHKYLKSLSPKRIKEIFDYNESKPSKINRMANCKLTDHNMMELKKIKSTDEEIKFKDGNFENNLNKNSDGERNYNISEFEATPPEFDKEPGSDNQKINVLKDVKFFSSNFNKTKKNPIQLNSFSTITHEAKNNSNFNPQIRTSHNKNFLTESMKTSMSNLTKNYKNLSPIRKHKNNYKKDLPSIMSDTRFKENHSDNYSKLYKSLSSFNINKEENEASPGNENIKNMLSLKKSGFKSYEIPHVYSEKKESKNFNSKFNILNEKMTKTFEYFKNPEDENNKMKEYLDIMSHQEATRKFPDIKSITNATKLNQVKIQMLSNKHLGQKYNPLNYDYNPLKSTIRRNLYGSLFNH